MNVPAKALIGLGAIGTVGGASYAISTQFTTENISKKLRDKGYQILKDDDEEWTLILASYLKSSKLNFKDFDIKENETEKLRQACQKALESPSTENDIYAKAEYWCTVPRDLKTLLVKSGYRALDTSDNDENADKTKWDTKLDEHAKTNARLEDKKFKGDENIKIKEPVAKQEANRKAIKQKCQGLESKKHYEIDFEANLEKSQLWCAIKENSPTVG